MATGNKRVTQLVAITSVELAADDLLYVADVSALESKKITVDQLSAYLSVSGSLYVLHAVTADTASYVLASSIVGQVASASWSSYANASLSSSYANTSSVSVQSVTASYALAVLSGSSFSVSASWASASLSSSYANRTSTADNATIAAFLFYSGGDNGTASYAITAGNTNHVTLADTASYFNNTFSTVASASYSSRTSIADVATASIDAFTASHLAYSPTNGSASYAIQAGSIAGVLSNKGLFTASFQSLTGSGIDIVTISSSLGTVQSTIIEAFGTSICTFTSSLPLAPLSLSLFVMDRLTGQSATLDKTNIGLNIPTAMGVWGSYITGSVTMPWNLIFQASMNSQYFIEVLTSSPKITLDPTRSCQFRVETVADFVTATGGPSIEFFVGDSSSVTLSFYTTASGPFTDRLPGFLSTGSPSMRVVNISNQNVSQVDFTWKLSNLNVFSCSQNALLTSLNYAWPLGLITMSCFSCGINSMAGFDNTTASYIDFSNNDMVTVPALSPSTSYLNIADNPITALPTFLPTSLRVLLASDTLLTGTLPNLPNIMRTASFDNTVIDTLPNPLPLSMSALSLYRTIITTFPTAPVSLSYLNVASTSLSLTEIRDITSDLVTNARLSGSLNVRGFGTFTDPVVVANFSSLTSNGWSVFKD